jgi:3-oxoacyl-[acyl-carrier protein] reductase
MNVIYPDLKDKTVLVTGSSRGIGAGIALALGAQGARVVLNGTSSEENSKTLMAEIEKLGGKAWYLRFDISDTKAMTAAIENFITAHGPITGLVNNAGIARDQIMMRLKEEDVDKTLAVNLKGAIMLTQILTRSFMKEKNVSIVNMSSVIGLMGNAAQVVYAASKAGLIGLTKSYAKEYASRGIRCNAVCPGLISTDMTKALTEKVTDNYLASIPLKRIGTPEDIANLVCFLLSQASSYMTGEVIKIDGGMYI